VQDILDEVSGFGDMEEALGILVTIASKQQ
jgi:hypothetical protein